MENGSSDNANDKHLIIFDKQQPGVRIKTLFIITFCVLTLTQVLQLVGFYRFLKTFALGVNNKYFWKHFELIRNKNEIRARKRF